MGGILSGAFAFGTGIEQKAKARKVKAAAGGFQGLDMTEGLSNALSTAGGRAGQDFGQETRAYEEGVGAQQGSVFSQAQESTQGDASLLQLAQNMGTQQAQAGAQFK